MSYYVTLEDAQGQRYEYGPFQTLVFAEETLSANGAEFAKALTTGGYLITNGEVLGDPNVTGTTWPVIWGQAKLT